MNKPYLLIPILEQDESIFTLLNSIKVDNWSKVLLLFDSSGWDYVQVIKQSFPLMGGIHNTSKPLGFTKMINLAIKEAAGSSVFILSQYAKLPEYFGLTIQTDGIQDFVGEEEYALSPLYGSFIHRDVINKIGYLDEAFVNSGSSEDYRLRSNLAGFVMPLFKPAPISISKKTLELNDFSLMQLRYKYSMPEGLTLKEMSDKILKDYKFNEDMVIR